ncbi:tetratricopeptide repeat protein [Kitasatospora sp. NPDC059146]|uniref:tetratricopeptide repeat protein n=1 Tax=Kitasatospora sp. NPDC059146 TaxID=3346741 RepID=UPI0036ACBB79
MGLIQHWRDSKAQELHREGIRLLNRGRARDAEPVAREAVRIRSKVFGPDDATTLASRVVWARALGGLQRHAEAEAELREVLRLAPDPTARGELVRWARLGLAQVQVRTGRAEEARAEAALLLELTGRADVEYTRAALAIEAAALSTLGRHAEAVARWTELEAAATATAGGGSPQALKARSDRTQALVYLGRFQEAEAQARALMDVAASGGPGGVLLGMAARNALVLSLTARGRAVEAEAEARTAVERAAGIAGLDARFLLTARLGLARALNAQGRHDEALSALRPALERPTPDPVGEEELEAALHLVAAVTLLGLGKDAAPSLEKSSELCRRTLGPNHHRALEVGTLRGRVLAAQGRLPEAREALRTNAAAWQEHFGEGHPKTRAAQQALAELG